MGINGSYRYNCSSTPKAVSEVERNTWTFIIVFVDETTMIKTITGMDILLKNDVHWQVGSLYS